MPMALASLWLFVVCCCVFLSFVFKGPWQPMIQTITLANSKLGRHVTPSDPHDQSASNGPRKFVKHIVARGTGELPHESFQGMLLQLRGRTGLTQRELATSLGMHWRSIQGWESGANYPSAASLRLLLVAYLELEPLLRVRRQPTQMQSGRRQFARPH